jgi:hypothetical protein
VKLPRPGKRAEKASVVAGAKNAGVVKKGDKHNFTGFDCSSGIHKQSFAAVDASAWSTAFATRICHSHWIIIQSLVPLTLVTYTPVIASTLWLPSFSFGRPFHSVLCA